MTAFLFRISINKIQLPKLTPSNNIITFKKLTS